MDYKYIDSLLEKYWKGDTSLEEEGELRAFFAQKTLPPSYHTFRPLFTYFEEEKKIRYKGKLPWILVDKHPAKKKMYIWPMAAAVLLIVAMVWTFSYFQPNGIEGGYATDTYEDPQVAYMEMKKAMELMSEKLNQGKNYGMKLSKFGELTLELKTK